MTAFMLQAVFISLSGVMAPGPLSAAIVGHSHRSAHAGALGALGHGVVEFPLMALILFGFATWADAPLVGPVVGLAGGLVLLWMGITMVVSARHGLPAIAPEGTDGSAFRAGVLLTGANPYFLVWWLSVGAALLLRSTEYGGVGIVLFAGAHWMCDLAWLWFLSAAVHRSGRAFGPRFSRLVVAVCGLFLLTMGVDFLVEGIGALRASYL